MLSLHGTSSTLLCEMDFNEGERNYSATKTNPPEAEAVTL
jgi:hypothetical protein